LEINPPNSLEIDFIEGASHISIRTEFNRWLLATLCHELEALALGLKKSLTVSTDERFQCLVTVPFFVVREKSACFDFMAAHGGTSQRCYLVCNRFASRIKLQILRQLGEDG
jgi:hypothetical protein